MKSGGEAAIANLLATGDTEWFYENAIQKARLERSISSGSGIAGNPTVLNPVQSMQTPNNSDETLPVVFRWPALTSTNWNQYSPEEFRGFGSQSFPTIGYNFQVADNTSFNNALDTSGGDAFLTLDVTQLQEGRTYFWRVRAKVWGTTHVNGPMSWHYGPFYPVLRFRVVAPTIIVDNTPPPGTGTLPGSGGTTPTGRTPSNFTIGDLLPNNWPVYLVGALAALVILWLVLRK